jgi:hypothetical protein
VVPLLILEEKDAQGVNPGNPFLPLGRGCPNSRSSVDPSAEVVGAREGLAKLEEPHGVQEVVSGALRVDVINEDRVQGSILVALLRRQGRRDYPEVPILVPVGRGPDEVHPARIHRGEALIPWSCKGIALGLGVGFPDRFLA